MKYRLISGKMRWMRILFAVPAILVLSYCAAAYFGKRNVAAEMIDRAVLNNGIVDMSFLGEKVCLIPEGLNPQFYADRFFPNKRIMYRGTDDSSGYWYVAAGAIKYDSETLLFAIDQDRIRWDTSQEPIRSHLHCAETLILRVKNGVWTYNRMESLK